MHPLFTLATHQTTPSLIAAIPQELSSGWAQLAGARRALEHVTVTRPQGDPARVAVQLDMLSGHGTKVQLLLLGEHTEHQQLQALARQMAGTMVFKQRQVGAQCTHVFISGASLERLCRRN